MITEYGFIDTEETIRPPTPQDDADYTAVGKEYAANARTLLMTVRKRMTGREEDECEKATGDHDDPDGFDCAVIDRLINQYSAEIAAWKDGGAKA
jgi:hypothetical protein